MTTPLQTGDKTARLARMLDMNEAYVRGARLGEERLDTLFNAVARAEKVENRIMVPLGIIGAVCIGLPFLTASHELKVAGLILGTIAGLGAVKAGFSAVNTRKRAMDEIMHAVEKRDHARLTAKGPVSGDF